MKKKCCCNQVERPACCETPGVALAADGAYVVPSSLAQTGVENAFVGASVPGLRVQGRGVANPGGSFGLFWENTGAAFNFPSVSFDASPLMKPVQAIENEDFTSLFANHSDWWRINRLDDVINPHFITHLGCDDIEIDKSYRMPADLFIGAPFQEPITQSRVNVRLNYETQRLDVVWSLSGFLPVDGAVNHSNSTYDAAVFLFASLDLSGTDHHTYSALANLTLTRVDPGQPPQSINIQIEVPQSAIVPNISFDPQTLELSAQLITSATVEQSGVRVRMGYALEIDIPSPGVQVAPGLVRCDPPTVVPPEVVPCCEQGIPCGFPESASPEPNAVDGTLNIWLQRRTWRPIVLGSCFNLNNPKSPLMIDIDQSLAERVRLVPGSPINGEHECRRYNGLLDVNRTAPYPAQFIADVFDFGQCNFQPTQTPENPLESTYSFRALAGEHNSGWYLGSLDPGNLGNDGFVKQHGGRMLFIHTAPPAQGAAATIDPGRINVLVDVMDGKVGAPLGEPRMRVALRVLSDDLVTRYDHFHTPLPPGYLNGLLNIDVPLATGIASGVVNNNLTGIASRVTAYTVYAQYTPSPTGGRCANTPQQLGVTVYATISLGPQFHISTLRGYPVHEIALTFALNLDKGVIGCEGYEPPSELALLGGGCGNCGGSGKQGGTL